jgi:hypothetical protein
LTTCNLFVVFWFRQKINLGRYEHFWEVRVIGGQPIKTFSNPFDQGSKLDNVKEFLGLISPKSVTWKQLVERSKPYRETVRFGCLL